MSSNSPTETQRLRALADLRIMDSASDPSFDRITHIAARHYDAPIALVSLVDESRQWFKSRVGLDVRETPRDISFCTHAIEDDEPFVVTDARAHPQFSDNPLVTGAPGIRFYVGCPLIVAAGVRVGTLCVIDREPRPGFSVADAAVLRELAALVVDEMELRLAREKAVAESRAKSDFIATMSHEVRTPMTAVMGFAGLLAETQLDERQSECVQQILQSGKHMVQLLNDVLDLSRIEAGRLVLTPEPFAPAELVRETVQLFAEQARSKGLALEMGELPADASAFVGDRARVRQVLINLLSNAVKFTDEGSVTVAARLGESAGGEPGLRLEVADTGIGIDPQTRAILFERFAQCDGRDTRRHYGAGLGLAICRELADLMGGTISAGGRPGGGTVFEAFFPSPS